MTTTAELKISGYDAATMIQVLAVLDAINPMNGYVNKFVDYKIADMLVSAHLLWEDESGDVFSDYEFDNWQRCGGDVRELAQILNLEIEIDLVS